MSIQKNILLQIKKEGQLYDLLVKTSAHNVVVDKATGETLKERLTKITKLLGNDGKPVAEQINEVKAKIEEIIGSAPETLDSIHEIADWINAHQADFDELKSLSDGIHAALDEKIGDIGEYNSVVEFLETKLATEEARCIGALNDEVDRAKAAEEANAAAFAENKEAIETETARAEEKEAELDKKIEDLFVVFESVDDVDMELIGKMACIFMDDDPIEAASEKDLILAAAQTDNMNINLVADITVCNSIDLSAYNIVSNGYEIKASSQDVVIKL